MSPITVPINPESEKPRIANLRSALVALMEKGILQVSQKSRCRPLRVTRPWMACPSTPHAGQGLSDSQKASAGMVTDVNFHW